MSKEFSVVWLTSLPAPYRFPIWKHIGQRMNLTVIFTNGPKNSRNWELPLETNWKSIYLNRKIFYFLNAQIIPNPFGFHRICKQGDTLVVGGGWEVPIHFTAAMYARLTNRKVYIIAESTLESHRFSGKLSMLIRRIYFSLAHKVFTVGEASSKALISCGLKEDKIIQLFNPVDVIFFSNVAKNQQISSRRGHSYLCVGRLIKLKNFDSVIRAFINLYNPGDTLTIVGDGDELRNLQDIVSSSKLKEYIFFLGNMNQSDLARIYSDAQTLVMPSFNEVWGMVAIEALASGCHVIASDKSGVSSSIKDMNGVYISSTDVASIERCMISSRAEYKNRIQNPEILKFTPEIFADAMIVEIVRQNGSSSHNFCEP